ncbi:MAG: methionine--tRNA ligase subunit beta, partial [Acutalibacteraceae bacterium]
KLFGVDAVRYYLLAEMPHANDGSLTYETFIERYNTDLANIIGNLVNRTVAMVNKYFGGVLPCKTCGGEFDDDLKATALGVLPKMTKAIDEFRMADAVSEVIALARRSNKYIDETLPWALAKDVTQMDRLSTVLYNLTESIRFIAVLLKPFMPDTAEKILAQLNCGIDTLDSLADFGAIPEGHRVSTASPLFGRIDAEKMLAEIAEAHKPAEPEAASVKKEIPGLAQIGIEDFAKVELTAAKIVDCIPVKRAKKLLCLTLDDGSGTPRTVASGIAKWYKPEDLIGHTVVCVTNLKPAVLCGVESQGMILAADCAEEDVKVLMIDNVPAGSRIR